LLGVNIGPLLYAMGLAVWFVPFTVLAGLLALVVLVIIFIVRTLRARRAKVDATGAKA
jgi:Flp pilus assembly protein TadB